MAKKKSVNAQFAEVATAAYEASFWRAEYVKRKLLLDAKNDLERMLLAQKELREFAIPLMDKVDESLTLPDPADTLLRLYFIYIFGSLDQKAVWDSIGDIPEHIREHLDYLLSVSNNYGYLPSELVTRASMDEILKRIANNEALPESPLLFGVGPQKEKLETSEALVRVIGLDPGRQSKRVRIADIDSFPDQIVCLRSLHKRFDVTEAVQKISDEVVAYIFEQKTQREESFSKAEKEMIVDLYKKKMKGNYGSTHREARAIGLWMWDQHLQSDKSISAIAREMKDHKHCKEHSASSVKTFSRILTSAQECIAAMDVLSIKKF